MYLNISKMRLRIPSDFKENVKMAVKYGIFYTVKHTLRDRVWRVNSEFPRSLPDVSDGFHGHRLEGNDSWIILWKPEHFINVLLKPGFVCNAIFLLPSCNCALADCLELSDKDTFSFCRNYFYFSIHYLHHKRIHYYTKL